MAGDKHPGSHIIQRRGSQEPEALRAALARLQSTTDAASGFAALGESLWWTVAISDRRFGDDIKTVSENDAHGKRILQGIRYARNRVGHDPQAMFFLRYTGGYQDAYAAGYGSWFWRDIAELPTAHSERPHAKLLRKRYVEVLQGRSAGDTLIIAMDYLLDRADAADG